MPALEKRGCLGRGEAFGCPSAICPPKRPHPFAHYRKWDRKQPRHRRIAAHKATKPATLTLRGQTQWGWPQVCQTVVETVLEGECFAGCRKRGSAKGVRSLFFVFGTLSVTFWSLFLMLLSLFSSLFCQTSFAGLLLRQGEFYDAPKRRCLTSYVKRRRQRKSSCTLARSDGPQFPNAVVLNAVGRRNTQMRAKERKWANNLRAQTHVRKRVQKNPKERKIANNQVWNNQVWELPRVSVTKWPT